MNKYTIQLLLSEVTHKKRETKLSTFQNVASLKKKKRLVDEAISFNNESSPWPRKCLFQMTSFESLHNPLGQ